MLTHGRFKSHSGVYLPWKINLDDWTEDDWLCCAKIICRTFFFSRVIGIPTGGTKLYEAVFKIASFKETYPILIVDDVNTTGQSFEKVKADLDEIPVDSIGTCVFSRGPTPNWVWPIFRVSEWAQCLATGTG